MSANVDLNIHPDYDQVIQDIVDYVLNYHIDSDEAWGTARNCLMDTLGCGLLALRFPECTKHLGPIDEGTLVPNGARVPGTQFRLDPVKAAWNTTSRKLASLVRPSSIAIFFVSPISTLALSKIRSTALSSSTALRMRGKESLRAGS